jgi:membrane-associated protease RseP (regulator of RpoE activity)
MTLGRGVLMTAAVAALAVAAAAYAGPKAPQAPQAPEAPAPVVEKKVVIFRSGGSWLGVQIADVDADRAREIGMKEEAGAEIQSVSPGSPAEEAGLQKGDVILEYQGTRIEGVMQLTRLVHETPAGRLTTVKIFRDGSTRSVQVKVGERGDGDTPEPDRRIQILRGHGDGPMHWTQIPDVPDVPEIPLIDFEALEGLEGIDFPGLLEMHGIGGRPRLGAIVDDVGPQLAEFFGLKQEGGVLVKSVKKGSAGDTAGLKAGDVIVRVDGETVEDTSDLHLALRGSRDKEVRLTVVRDRREQAITIPPAPEPEVTPRAHRPGGAPAAPHRDIQREIERALRDAQTARAATTDAARARAEAQRAIEASRQAIEKALRDAAAVAPEAPIDEEDIDEDAADGEDVAAPAPRAPVETRRVSDRDRDAIRRAVEEARRIRTGMQDSANE